MVRLVPSAFGFGQSDAAAALPTREADKQDASRPIARKRIAANFLRMPRIDPTIALDCGALDWRAPD